jgi:hypothetical protein
VSAGKGAASAAPEYPRTLAAAQKAEGDLWTLADAVLLEIGPPAEDGWNDGSQAKFEECSEYLADRGLEYAPHVLRDYRNMAHIYTAASRVAAVSFTAHKVARSPEILAEAIRRNKGKPPSTRFIEQLRREIREKEEHDEELRRQREHRRAAEKAERERQKAELARREAIEDAAAQRRAEAAERRAREAQARAEQIQRDHQLAVEAKARREREEAERKATQVAQALEDKRVAEALASSGSLGSRRISNAVHEQEAARRRKVREENERINAAGAMPLPAFVPKMIGDIDGWVIGMRGITDDDLAGLPDSPLVRQLRNVIEDLAVEALRWSTVLHSNGSRGLPELEVIEGRVSA